jgi:hypothetical protein
MHDPDFLSPINSNFIESRNGLDLTGEQQKRLTPKQTGYNLGKK